MRNWYQDHKYRDSQMTAFSQVLINCVVILNENAGSETSDEAVTTKAQGVPSGS